MAVNKEAGKRSEVPFSRREEGRELGEKRKREKALSNTYRKAFKEDFGNMEVLIKEEEVCDFSGGDAA